LDFSQTPYTHGYKNIYTNKKRKMMGSGRERGGAKSRPENLSRFVLVKEDLSSLEPEYDGEGLRLYRYCSTTSVCSSFLRRLRSLSRVSRQDHITMLLLTW
jgi:hypothetical protein